LFADFSAGETTWAHIQATQAVIETFGLPLRFYVDSLGVPLLHRLRAPRLARSKAPTLFPSAVVGAVASLQGPADLAHRLSLAYECFNLSESVMICSVV
jgi:hypothetical protein